MPNELEFGAPNASSNMLPGAEFFEMGAGVKASRRPGLKLRAGAAAGTGASLGASKHKRGHN